MEFVDNTLFLESFIKQLITLIANKCCLSNSIENKHFLRSWVCFARHIAEN